MRVKDFQVVLSYSADQRQMADSLPISKDCLSGNRGDFDLPTRQHQHIGMIDVLSSEDSGEVF